MSERERDQFTGVETTGHEWDGIKELDNPLPRWWLWVFYACIAVAAVYWVLMPAWPGLTGYTHGVLRQSDRSAVVGELGALAAKRQAGESQLRTATVEQIEANPTLQAYAMEVGQSAFGDNCVGCHGAGGAGVKGYPNLRDDVWLWGGSVEDIRHTIEVGVRSGHADARGGVAMPAFGRDQMLTEAQIGELTEYVVALSGRPVDAGAVARARPNFEAQCAACHGPSGQGGAIQGAPNLTDADWLYGADRNAIRDQIYFGRNGVMPTWQARFSPETIKALAVYVHVNAGGDAEPAAAAAPPIAPGAPAK